MKNQRKRLYSKFKYFGKNVFFTNTESKNDLMYAYLKQHNVKIRKV